MRTAVLVGMLSWAVVQGAVLTEAVAQSEPAVEPAAAEPTVERQDPPGRVARLAYKDGAVVMAPAGTEEWAEAILNRPLTTGDKVWVEKGGKAELQTGSTSIYLNETTGFSVVDLDDELLHAGITDGAATIRVRRKLDNESIEIETPNATVRLLHPGEYHIEVAEDGAATVVRTRSGESEVIGERDTFRVKANERGLFRGAQDLSGEIIALGPRTAFEDWANERERRAEQSQTARYVSRDVIGYEDLDRDGEWIDEPEYGYVWRPTYVVADWAPYRYGRWVWVSPWGWSWVDNARWGFAPFHYGRWAYLRSRWCWVPGPRHVRPIYAPALVGWVGGTGLTVSLSFGSGVGWFPLGPREIYVPGYWHSRRYIHNVNFSNTLIVNNIYLNNSYYRRGGRYNYRYGHRRHAVTVVSRDNFRSGRRLDGRYVNVEDRNLRNWHRYGGAPAIAPERESVLASRAVDRRPAWRPLIRPEHLDAGRGNTEFLARRAPPARISFDAERRAVEANRGRPVDRSRMFTNNPREAAYRRGELRAGWAPARGAVRSAEANPRAPEMTSLRSGGTAGAARERTIRGGAGGAAPLPAAPVRRDDRPSWGGQLDADRSRGASPSKRAERERRSDGRGGAVPPPPKRYTPPAPRQYTSPGQQESFRQDRSRGDRSDGRFNREPSHAPRSVDHSVRRSAPPPARQDFGSRPQRSSSSSANSSSRHSSGRSSSSSGGGRSSSSSRSSSEGGRWR